MLPFLFQSFSVRSVLLLLAGAVLFSLNGCGRAAAENPQEGAAAKSSARRDAYSIPGTKLPPKYWRVPGGSCGEACLWTVLHKKGITTTQKAINRAGGAPGRGLHSGELFRALRHYGVAWKNISANVRKHGRYLANVLLKHVRAGHPVLLGVKVLPDRHPDWACDHFILLTGYNKNSQELIYHSNAKQRRMPAGKLLTTLPGYSIINRQNYVFALAFP